MFIFVVVQVNGISKHTNILQGTFGVHTLNLKQKHGTYSEVSNYRTPNR